MRLPEAWMAGVGDDCRVEFVIAGGESRCLPLPDCAATRFEDMEPVRGFPSFRCQKNFPGLWWCATTGSHVGYESWVERDWLMAFDYSPDVTAVSSQPFRLMWAVDGKSFRHTPDFFLRLRDGGAAVVDVRPDPRVRAGDQAVFDRTVLACGSVGWEYRRVGEMPAVRAANLRWLAGYRYPRCRRPEWAARFGEVFAAARPLADGVAEVGDPIAVLPTLFHLLWCQEIAADLEAGLLSPGTVIGGGSR